MQRREGEDHLVGRGRGDVLLEHRLHAVGEGLQQPERAGAVGAGTLLHAADDAPLEPDHQQRADQQVDEDRTALIRDSHHGVSEKSAVGFSVAGERRQAPTCADAVEAEAHAAPPFGTSDAVAPASSPAGPSRDRRTSPASWSAARRHRRPSGRSRAPARVTDPWALDTVTRSPSATPSARRRSRTAGRRRGAPCRRGTARRPAGGRRRAGSARSPGRNRPCESGVGASGEAAGAVTEAAVTGPRAQRRELVVDLLLGAGLEEVAELGGQHVEHAVVAHRVGLEGVLERPDPALPVDERARPSRRAARPAARRRRPR